jgi:hypothetical protein
MYIFLDDYRVPSDVKWIALPPRPDGSWTIVRSFEELKELLGTLDEAPEFIAFDHDLADAHYNGDFSNPDEKTGYDCAKLVASMAFHKWKTIPPYVVHSLNPIGKKNIEMFLENARKHLGS